MKTIYQRLALFGALTMFLAGTLVGVHLSRVNDKRLNVLIQAYNYILRDWFEGVEDESINPDFLNAFLNSLVDDRHTYYTSTIKSVDDSYSAGFGFSFNYYNTYPRIVSLEPNSPIGQATSGDQRIAVGDYIVAINGESTQDTPSKRRYAGDLGKLFKSNSNPNEIDEFVILKADANGNYDLEGLSNSLTYQIKAGWYSVETSKSQVLAGNVGYLKLSSFEMNTPGLTRNHLAKLATEGVRDLILDLRGNPGGFIDSIVEIAGLFLPEGSTVAIFIYKDGSREYVYAGGGTKFTFDNFFILTDGYSASASEMLTGALVDNQVATQVGEKTYGKGSAQKTIRLGIDEGQLTYTYAVWTTLGREAIHKVGITPDQEHQVAPDGFYQLPFHDYSDSYNYNQVADILNLIDAIGYPTIEANGWDAFNLQALNNFRADVGLLPTTTYDFSSFIALSNARIDNRQAADMKAIEHCLRLING